MRRKCSYIIDLEARKGGFCYGVMWDSRTTHRTIRLISISGPSPLTIVTSHLFFLMNQCQQFSVTQKSYFKNSCVIASPPCFHLALVGCINIRKAGRLRFTQLSSELSTTLIRLVPTTFTAILLGVSRCINIYYLFSPWIYPSLIWIEYWKINPTELKGKKCMCENRIHRNIIL